MAAVSESGVPKILPRSCSSGEPDAGLVLALPPLLLLLLPDIPGPFMLRLRADRACCADWLKRFS